MGDEHGFLTREIEELHGMRDELKLKVHLGRMEARDRWEALEERFADLEARARRVGEESEEALEDLGEAMAKGIRELREGYAELRASLPASASSTRERLWKKLAPAVDSARQAGERVRHVVVQLQGDARLRLEQARIERVLQRRHAELGKRIFELSVDPRTQAVAPLPEDASTRALVSEIKSLDGRLRRCRTDAAPRIRP